MLPAITATADLARFVSGTARDLSMARFALIDAGLIEKYGDVDMATSARVIALYDAAIAIHNLVDAAVLAHANGPAPYFPMTEADCPCSQGYPSACALHEGA